MYAGQRQRTTLCVWRSDGRKAAPDADVRTSNAPPPSRGDSPSPACSEAKWGTAVPIRTHILPPPLAGEGREGALTAWARVVAYFQSAAKKNARLPLAML